MKKRVTYALIAIITLGILVGIIYNINGKKKVTDDNMVIDLLNEITKYRSDVTIEVKNDREKNKYNGVQFYKKNIGSKLEIDDGRVFIFKGGDINVKDNNNTKTYTIDKNFDEVLKYGFIGEYVGLIYTNEELEFQKEAINDKEYFVITTIIPGNNNNICEGSLYYSLDEHLPKKLVLFDSNHNERVVYTYDNFDWTYDINDVEFDY